MLITPMLSGWLCLAMPAPPDDVSYDVVAALEMSAERHRDDHAFRAVVLQMPYAYVMDREGDLYVFEVPTPTGMAEGVDPLHVIPQAGDGVDIAVVGPTLVTCRFGHLEVYSLEDRAEPTHVGRFGPQHRHFRSAAIIEHETLVFVVGENAVAAYDVSEPLQPRLAGRAASPGVAWSGCTAADRLFLAERSPQCGIRVFDVSEPDAIRETAFVPTTRAPYHIFAATADRLVVSLGADSVFHGGRAVSGNVAVLDISDPDAPTLIEERSEAGGRAATMMTVGGAPRFVCFPAVFDVGQDGLGAMHLYDVVWQREGEVMSAGSTVDGAPYRGASDGDHAALALHTVVIVLQAKSRESAP